MRHRKAGRKLNRPTPHRKAMLRNLVKDFLTHGAIQTTEARAKETQPYWDKKRELEVLLGFQKILETRLAMENVDITLNNRKKGKDKNTGTSLKKI